MSSFKSLCSRYKQLCDDTRQLELHLACCNRRLAQLAEQGRTSHELATLHDRTAQLGEQLCTVTARLDGSTAAIRTTIATLPDQRLRTILELRYLDGLPWAQVSEATALDLRWLMRLHKKALAQLDKI